MKGPYLPRVALISDLREEQWHSMDLVSELLLLGLRDPGQRGLEGIEVVAHHQRAVRRQTGRQVRVAVIHDVEEIEVGGLRTQPPRIVPEPVHEPIRRGDAPHATGPW